MTTNRHGATLCGPVYVRIAKYACARIRLDVAQTRSFTHILLSLTQPRTQSITHEQPLDTLRSLSAIAVKTIVARVGTAKSWCKTTVGEWRVLRRSSIGGKICVTQDVA